MHTDNQDTFILQLDGSKIWTVYQNPTVRSPFGELSYILSCTQLASLPTNPRVTTNQITNLSAGEHVLRDDPGQAKLAKVVNWCVMSLPCSRP